MNKTNFFLLILIISGSFLCVSCSMPEVEKKKPNIVFILADDLGWADLPVYGNQFNEAPHIQKLAEEGSLFSNAYTSSPVCSPTRASIQSGLYPARIGITDFIPGHFRPYEKVVVPENKFQYLPPEIHTIGEVLSESGYKTGYFGKWHLGPGDNYHPSTQGYDEAIEYRGGGYFSPKFIPDQDIEPGKQLSELLTEMGTDFIERHKSEPFFLFLSHFDVHIPLDADSSDINYFVNKPKVKDYPCNAIYAALIKNLDNSVKRIVEKIEEHNLSENTILIFYSDNGGLINRYDGKPLIANSKQHIYADDSMLYIASSNAPLRGEKGTLYEGGIRVPLIIKWPGKVRQGEINPSIVTSVDFYPTIAELVNSGELPKMTKTDGQSLLKMLTGNDNLSARPIFWHYPVYHHSSPASAVRKGEWKLIHFLDSNSLELYNLKDDPSETKNLVHSNKEVLNELKNLLDNWREEVGAEYPKPNSNFDPSRRQEWGKRKYGK